MKFILNFETPKDVERNCRSLAKVLARVFVVASVKRHSGANMRIPLTVCFSMSFWGSSLHLHCVPKMQLSKTYSYNYDSFSTKFLNVFQVTEYITFGILDCRI